MLLYRACKCWDTYRIGKCSDRLSNYIGEKVVTAKAKDSSYRYYMRTSRNGEPLRDTSRAKGYDGDFVYDFDKTCDEGGNPRRYFAVWF